MWFGPLSARAKVRSSQTKPTLTEPQSGEVQGRTQNSSMYEDEATLKITYHKDKLAPEEFLA